MKYGAIDIGTNSVRLLIVTIDDGRIKKSIKTLETTRIGEDVDKAGELSTAAIDRTICALKKFKLLIEEEGLSYVPIIATSAVRDAKNKQVLVQRVKSEVGMDMHIISGEKEAELGFCGVLEGMSRKTEEDILVIDIGGGSTELIIGNSNGIKYMVSCDIGAVRMTEKFIRNDIVTEEEINEMISFIEEILKPELTKIKDISISRVVGIGGTATTLAAVDQSMDTYDQEKIHNHSLRIETIKQILVNFIQKDLENRIKISGLQPKRADVIIAGTIILVRIMDLIGSNDIRISEYDNLEGLVFEQMRK